MISVAEAVARITAAFSPLPAETVPLGAAYGRVLAEDAIARVTQPPFAVSAMDGYAARAADVADTPTVLREIGRVPAGERFDGTVGQGETVRIFTGARVPEGADTIIIQENTAAGGSEITVREGAAAGRYIRPAGLDFHAGEVGLTAGCRLNARAIGLAAAMNLPWLAVRRKPRIALLATGDEIVMPGEPIGENQIVSSNVLALSAVIAGHGGDAINLGIALDNEQSLRRLATGARGADLLVTTGGASVGEHDLIRSVLGDAGLELDFWKIAMRPGKPLMFGQLGETRLLGLPGNPVSSLVCSLIFLRPALDRLLGLAADPASATQSARLGTDLGTNDERQDYLRAALTFDEIGLPLATPYPKQDSSMVSLLAKAQCLIVRPPHAEPAASGTIVEIIRLDGDTPSL
jgi:molybdopterin molybdotransferase